MHRRIELRSHVLSEAPQLERSQLIEFRMVEQNPFRCGSLYIMAKFSP
jgi:hypothetical protein